MKPNFALILSFEGIGLLHRVSAGWAMLGEAGFKGDDLGAKLAALREKAAGIEPAGLHCALVLPEEQIKYISLPRGDISEADAQQTALRALEGATPYTVDDLVVDWALTDDQLHIAAVARETLTEAENFALENGFEPVCFVAAPEKDVFTGAPYFGVTSCHDAGDPIERDETPIRASKPANDTPEAEAPETDPEVTVTSAPRVDNDLSDTAPDIAAETADAPAKAAPLEPDFTGVADAALPDEPDAPEPPRTAQTASPATKSAGFSSSRPLPPARVKPVATPISSPLPDRTPSSSANSEKARMTVFGIRDQAKSQAGPGRSFMALAAGGVVALIGLAILASLTFEDGLAGLFHGSDRAQISQLPEPVQPPQPEIQPTPIDESLAASDTAISTPKQAIDEAVMASLQPTDDVPPEPSPERSEEPQQEISQATPQETPKAVLRAQETLTLPEPLEITPDEARTRYAATGIWLLAPKGPRPPLAENLENFYQASIDSSLDGHDAFALPPAPAPDFPPHALVSPPKPGTKFNLDSRGLVSATKEGARTPEGILVYAGRPPVLPPARPGTPAGSVATGPDLARLQKLRPRPRPEDLAEQHERSALGGRTIAELAGLRPRLRPQSAQEAAAETAQPQDLPALNITAAQRPAARPEGFSKTVALIKASQLPQDSSDQPQSTSALAPATPTIPTSASISRRATDTNAIKLRQLNLIGVYGTPKNRRALVRLPNGRYRKVVIGDKLDGGEVAAIGDAELRYIKRGRSVVLKMPNG
jgi:hypothetical protein